MHDLISIIVPVYNVEKYLIKCLDSILSQTYQDFEVILINDGSIDNSGAICDEYVKKSTRFHVIHKENGGLSSARNAGLKVAKGKYICFIDSDDWVREELLEQLIYLLQSHGGDISECDFFSDESEDVYSKEQVIQSYTRDKYMVDLLENKIPSYFCGKLFKKLLFEHQFFPMGKTYEDLLFMPQIIMNAAKIIVTNQKYYFYYRSRSDSITNDPRYRVKNQIAIAEAFRSRYVLASSSYKVDHTVLKRAVESSICAFCLLKNLKVIDDQSRKELALNFQFIDKQFLEIKRNRKIRIWYRWGAFFMLHSPNFFCKIVGVMMEMKYRLQNMGHSTT